MVDNQTWEAVCSSEIFSEFVKNELKREASEQESSIERIENSLDTELEIYAEVAKFQQRVDSDPKVKAYFKACVAKLAANPELKKSVSKDFLRGLELLDLSEGE